MAPISSLIEPDQLARADVFWACVSLKPAREYRAECFTELQQGNESVTMSDEDCDVTRRLCHIS
jgi:hypothetical protein